MLAQTLISIAALEGAMGLLIFLAAGTLAYWQGWVFLGVFLAVTLVVSLDVYRRDPALLRRRLSGGPTAEKTPRQRLIMLLASIGYIGLLVVPGLDFRFGWSDVPTVVVALGDGLVAVGFYLVMLVYRENSFTSATIEVAEGQKVVSTGPYALVRHPMYASSLVYLLGMPLALASYWGLLVLALMLPVLIWRLLDEERFLARHLSGYTAYQARVRYRLLPHVW